MNDRYPFYAQLFEELKREYLESKGEEENSRSVKEWLDLKVKEGRIDKEILPMLHYELGSEFGTSIS
jgi:hypothetical protein